jgi:2,4-dichlorophenol 6-monooxygenase
VIGPAPDADDIYDDWTRAREIEETGCVLVRPDAHVAWRSAAMVEDPVAELGRVMESLLGISPVSSSVLASSGLGRRDTVGGEK